MPETESLEVSGSVPDFQRLKASVNRAVDGGAAPGMAVGLYLFGQCHVITAGKRSLRREEAIDSETRFPLGCLIKPLLSLICLELQVQGKLDIERSVEEYLPELKSPFGPGQCITLRDLLCHSGGFEEPSDPKARWTLSWPSFVDFYTHRRQPFRPGSVWSYTQTGHAIVGRIVELVSGRDPIETIRESLLAPLKISDPPSTGRGVANANAATPHVRSTRKRGFEPIRLPRESGFFRYSISDVALTAEQLTSLTAMIGGQLRPGGISPEGYELFASSAINVPPASGTRVREAPPDSYGLGLGHYGDAVGHNGSLVGTTCALRFDPNCEVGAAVATNAWNPGLRDRVCATLMHAMTGNSQYLLQPRCRVPMPLHMLQGRFKALALGVGEAEFNYENGRLLAEIRNSGEPINATISVGQDGHLIVTSSATWLTFAAAREEITGEPYWLIGMGAYKRIGHAGDQF